ncbi:HVA22-like protein k [Citrus sinensis]|uniref:HVA22-like protein k n=1 Tax=Citrus sinensis TaxID=2711 RepID=A0ACB8JFK3_CITSI|nr:HVA22-like protein k [Citrus sinensis]
MPHGDVRCSVGVALPVYSTFKGIERKDEDEQQKWLMYWAAYGTFSIAEAFADKFLTWFPMYYHLKFAFLVWLQLPSTDGARQLYENYLSPFLLRCQAKADQLRATTHAKFDQLRAITQAKVDQLRALTLRPFLLTCQAKIDQLRAIEDMVGRISSIKAEIKCGGIHSLHFSGQLQNIDPNKPEGRNAVEDLDGITSDTNTESDLEVEESLIMHVSFGKLSYSCYEPRPYRRISKSYLLE